MSLITHIKKLQSLSYRHLWVKISIFFSTSYKRYGTVFRSHFYAEFKKDTYFRFKISHSEIYMFNFST